MDLVWWVWWEVFRVLWHFFGLLLCFDGGMDWIVALLHRSARWAGVTMVVCGNTRHWRCRVVPLCVHARRWRPGLCRGRPFVDTTGRLCRGRLAQSLLKAAIGYTWLFVNSEIVIVAALIGVADYDQDKGSCETVSCFVSCQSRSVPTTSGSHIWESMDVGNKKYSNKIIPVPEQ